MLCFLEQHRHALLTCKATHGEWESALCNSETRDFCQTTGDECGTGIAAQAQPIAYACKGAGVGHTWATC
jgi:hypothetical protein